MRDCIYNSMAAVCEACCSKMYTGSVKQHYTALGHATYEVMMRAISILCLPPACMRQVLKLNSLCALKNVQMPTAHSESSLNLYSHLVARYQLSQQTVHVAQQRLVCFSYINLKNSAVTH
jgi:hypothetical protein